MPWFNFNHISHHQRQTTRVLHPTPPCITFSHQSSDIWLEALLTVRVKPASIKLPIPGFIVCVVNLLLVSICCVTLYGRGLEVHQPSSPYNNNWVELIRLHAPQCRFSAGVRHRHPVTCVCHVDGGANGLCHVRENVWRLFPLFPCWGYWSMFNSPIMPESISRPIHNYHAGAR